MPPRFALPLAGALVVGAAALTGCGSSDDSADATTVVQTVTDAAPAAADPGVPPPATSAAAPTSAPAPSTPNDPAALLAGLPTPSGASTEPIADGGVHVEFTTDTGPAKALTRFGTALAGAGWRIESSGGGGGGDDGYGGGGGGLTTSKGSSWLALDAGGGDGSTGVDICVWPERPSDEDCDD